MSSLTRTIRRSIARKNGTLKPNRGRSPSYRGQIFQQRVSTKKDHDRNAFLEMLAMIIGRKAKK